MENELIGRLDLQSAQAWALYDATKKPLWAWVAGIIDGEGSITLYMRISQRKKNQGISLAVSMTHKAAIYRLREITETGSVCPKKASGLGKKSLWTWKCASSQAASVLRLCLPWLVVKREDALLALAFHLIRPVMLGRNRGGKILPAYAEHQKKVLLEASRLLHDGEDAAKDR